MNEFVHLHGHSEISDDGLGPVDKYVEYAKKIGFSSIAVTDHGSLGNSISFWSSCQNHGIKPILGNEIYLGWKSTRYHLTLNSLNQEGFHNLIALNNEAHQNWVSGYPVTTVAMLEKYAKGIAFFSGCPASPMHSGTFAEASEFIGTMYEIFGKDNSYIEFMYNDTITRSLEMQKRFGMKALVTNDVHYTKPEYKHAQQIMYECRKGHSYENDGLHMRTAQEMYDTGIRYLDGGLVKSLMQETVAFADRVEPWSMISKPKLPDCSALIGPMMDAIWLGFEKDIAKVGESHRANRYERLNFELMTLEDTGFIDYFAILNDIITFAKKSGIVVGPGRGSAAGCYALYLLGITNVDPIFYNLYFDRFINKNRKEFPDVDIDIESDRRGEVIEYAKKRWGAFPIATYSTYNHKILIHDLSRKLKLDKEISDKAADAGPESELFEEFLSLHPELPTLYEAMEGQIRHTGKHAGGVIITNQPAPIERNGDEYACAWVEGLTAKQLTMSGIVKYDILGLQSLSQLAMMRKLTGVDFEKLIPENDLAPLKLFRDGDVLGIFQWTGSDGIRDLTIKIAPETFDDLAVIGALYRPGALDAGTAQLYPDFKLEPRKFHPVIDEILKDTYGVIVYQEQVMAIFAKVVGGTLADADVARRVIFKARPEDPIWIKSVEDLKQKFVDGGLVQGFTHITLDKIWGEIQTHSRYSFNRAHTAAYAYISYWMAWYKFYHPSVFYATMFSYDSANSQGYILEMIRKGITIEMPSINQPNIHAMPLSDTSIVLPLNIVKGVSENTISKIIDEFNLGGPFKSLEDFSDRIPKRMCNSRVRTNLRFVDAFRDLKGNEEKFFGVAEAEKLTPEVQNDILGFVLPSKNVLEFIDEAEGDDSIVCGFVSTWHDKTNKSGKRYRVYRMTPSGMFWTDNEDRIDKIKKGDLLKIKKTNFGKALTVTRKNI